MLVLLQQLLLLVPRQRWGFYTRALLILTRGQQQPATLFSHFCCWDSSNHALRCHPALLSLSVCCRYPSDPIASKLVPLAFFTGALGGIGWAGYTVVMKESGQ
jgi:hypothetical protein